MPSGQKAIGENLLLAWRMTSIHRDPALMSEIRAGLAALKSKKAKLYTLEELFTGDE